MASFWLRAGRHPATAASRTAPAAAPAPKPPSSRPAPPRPGAHLTTACRSCSVRASPSTLARKLLLSSAYCAAERSAIARSSSSKCACIARSASARRFTSASSPRSSFTRESASAWKRDASATRRCCAARGARRGARGASRPGRAGALQERLALRRGTACCCPHQGAQQQRRRAPRAPRPLLPPPPPPLLPLRTCFSCSRSV
jgi:hypothetical protein